MKRMYLYAGVPTVVALVVVTYLLVKTPHAPAYPVMQKPPEDGLGYSKAFEAALQDIGQISPEQFAARYPLPQPYLKELPTDPSTAKYFDQFALDPAMIKDRKSVV